MQAQVIKFFVKATESRVSGFLNTTQKLEAISKHQELEYAATGNKENDMTAALAIAKRRIIRKAEQVTK